MLFVRDGGNILTYLNTEIFLSIQNFELYILVGGLIVFALMRIVSFVFELFSMRSRHILIFLLSIVLFTDNEPLPPYYLRSKNKRGQDRPFTNYYEKLNAAAAMRLSAVLNLSSFSTRLSNVPANVLKKEVIGDARQRVP